MSYHITITYFNGKTERPLVYQIPGKEYGLYCVGNNKTQLHGNAVEIFNSNPNISDIQISEVETNYTKYHARRTHKGGPKEIIVSFH